jgi:hypothetical protein
MDVYLRGSSPAAVTAAILILTRARQLGDRITVYVVGDPDDAMKILGPALCYAPVLASCGVGREFGSGATVVIPGSPGEPLLVTIQPHGIGGWFPVDRKGNGAHPATQAFVRLSHDPRVEARHLSKEMRRAMEGLGLSTDPAVLDVLFGVEGPPLLRIAIALRAGRAMSGGRGESITRLLTGNGHGDPIAGEFEPERTREFAESGKLNWILDGFSTTVRDRIEEWVATFQRLSKEDGGRDLVLLHHLAEIASHLVLLPPHSILPPLGAAEDSVAVGLKSALSADDEQGDANAELRRMFVFLGGRFTQSPPSHVLDVGNEPPPKDTLGRLEWFCSQVRLGRKRADEMWPNIIDPPS